MEILDVILSEVKQIRREQSQSRKELTDHIRDEALQFDNIKKDIGCLRTQSALRKQHGNIINAGIAALVAGIISWFAVVFGMKD